jgi:pimeloyl-ACP methyl ester carboxylesterase
MSQGELAHMLGVFEVDDQATAENLVAHLWERGPGVEHEALAAQWLNRLSNQVLRSLLRTRVRGDSLTASHLSGLHVATLVLWAERDRILPRRCLDFFGNLPDVRLEIVPGWGHCAAERDMPQLAKRIHEFSAN